MTELVTNGGFDADASWTKDTNWTISGGQALAAASTTVQLLHQPVNVVKGGVYVVTFDVANYSAGNVRCSFNGTDVGATRSANGTYSETITLTLASTEIRFGGASGTFTGRVDNVSVQGLSSVVDEQGLGAALTAVIQGNYASPEQRARSVVQAYLNAGTGANVAIAINEAALAVATSSTLAPFPSRALRVRAAIEAYIATVAA